MQTIVNLDGFVDKCLVTQVPLGDIVVMVNLIFPNTTFRVSDVEKRIECVKHYKEQLTYLRTLPKIEQRTPAWYDARQTLITASDFAQALGDGKFGTQKQLIQKKCGFEEDHFNNSAPALKWGCMLEDVACTIYAQRNGMVVHDFGLLRHPEISFVGASPDGVTEFGIMVEIKCPFKRKIDGTVPLQYFYQIQGQLDVCGLDECDYWECEFVDSEDANEIGVHTLEKSIILEKADGTYTYGPVSHMFTGAHLEDWTAENKTDDVVHVHYIALTKCCNIRVYKDANFLTEKLELLGQVWERIKGYRADEELYNKEIKSAAKASPYKLPSFAFI